jgi:Ca-activated chloride channel family protein
MTLAAPLGLLALLLLPLVAAVQRLSRGRRARLAVRHPGAAVMAGVLRAGPAWKRHLPAVLLTAAALALSIALARPQAVVAVPVEQASVVLVTDHSGSMVADDVRPSRLGAAQAAARAFLGRVPDALLVGFAGYSTGVDAAVPPTTDRAQVRAAVDALAPDGGTATGDALTAALDQLEARREKGETAPAAIVLLSDGKTTRGSDPLEVARRAARLHVPISTVALGTSGGTVFGPNGEPIAVPPDPETLRAIATTSGGTAFEAADADALDDVYRRLGSRIGTRRKQREITAGFAGAGLLLLAGGVGTGLRRRGRLL